MDNMAYLQQIAVKDKVKNDDSLLKKILNPKLIFGVLGVIVLIIATVFVLKMVKQANSKDKNFLTQAYFQAKYLNDKTIKKYSNKAKDANIRSMTASLKGVLNEISVEEGALLVGVYNEDLSELEADELAIDELTTNTILNATLDNAILNGLFERVYIREMTLQLAYLISYHSGCIDTTKDDKVKAVLIKEKASLENIYDQFYNFTSPTI